MLLCTVVFYAVAALHISSHDECLDQARAITAHVLSHMLPHVLSHAAALRAHGGVQVVAVDMVEALAVKSREIIKANGYDCVTVYNKMSSALEVRLSLCTETTHK